MSDLNQSIPDRGPGARSTSPDPKIESVRKWLEERKPELGALDPDLDLIENRVIDSLTFTEFLFFLEELTGHEIGSSPTVVASFRTLRTIERDILGGAMSPPGDRHR